MSQPRPADFFRGNGLPYPAQFEGVQERLLAGPTGARLLLVVPPEFGTNDWLTFLAAWRLAYSPGRVLLKSYHRGLTTKRRIQAARFARALSPNVPEGVLAVLDDPSGLLNLAIFECPRGASSSPGAARREVDELQKLSAQLGAAGDIVVSMEGRQPTPGGDLAERLARLGWEVVTIPAVDEQGRSTFPEGYSTEDLLRARGDVGAELWASFYMGQPAKPREETGPASMRLGIEACFSCDPRTGAKGGPFPMAKWYETPIPACVPFNEALQVAMPTMRQWAKALSTRTSDDAQPASERVAFVIHIETKDPESGALFTRKWEFAAQVPSNASAQQVHEQLSATGAPHGLGRLALEVAHRMEEVCK